MRLAKYLKEKVHSNVHFLKMAKKYSIGFYTGGISLKDWNNATEKEREDALKKDWYLRWSYRKDKDLVRQPNIKSGVNYYKTKEERIKMLEIMKQELEDLLHTGWSPYENNELDTNITDKSISDCITFALDMWQNSVRENTYKDYKSRLGQFEKWLYNKGYKNRYIKSVTRKVITSYLNEVLKNTSPKNRNNQRACISSFFSLLEKNEYVTSNPVEKIQIVKAKPKRNKTYTLTQEKEIFDYLEKNDTLLLLFVKFVSYNFLRPIEVARLQIKDIDFADKQLTVRAKNKVIKTKIIPDILMQELSHLQNEKKDFYLFSPQGPAQWETTEVNRRDYWSKRFKKVKDVLGLGKDYGIYSFRHTFITKLYREFRKDLTPFETKSRLMLITGHTTMTALEKYLRDIDAELPEDYSKFIK